MSVSIQVFGAKPESDEYQGALILKDKFQNAFPSEVIGEIQLQANATLFGQTVKDIDIIMMGTLQNYSLPLSFSNKNNEIIKDKVEICSFCTVIEVKSHGIKGIMRQGTEIWVRYGNHRHSVTSQSNDQKIAAMNFFSQTLKNSPYMTNLIWFTGLTHKDLNDLLTMDENPMPTNTFASDFSVEELMQLLVWQKKPFIRNGAYCFDCGYGNSTPEKLAKQFRLFAVAKDNMGELSRKRIEQLTNKAFSNINISDDDRMSIYRGRAGTGKTVGLIQTAIKLVDERDKRVIILTYNKALVSDIRRLFALAELPDMFEESCVYINTMHSYFYHIISEGLYNGNLDGEAFISNYEAYLQELLDFIKSDKDSINCLKKILDSNCYLSWDYCLIDEAQDWMAIERDLIVKIFGINCVVVADGGQQFVRNIGSCDWNISEKRNNVKLKHCLRQKSNLIKFINHYSEEYGKSENKIIGSDKMPGGKIIICSDPDKKWSILKDSMTELKSYGNIPYDMMFLVPPSLVDKKPRRFTLINEFEKHNFFVWDGTNEDIRSDYSIAGDEVRVLQYDSARGLEAWTVVCLDFDDFIDEKMRQYDFLDNVGSSLLLESAEEKRIKYILNWALIPFTRAIDTLIITIKDSSSDTASILKRIAVENPDYVSFI